MSEIEEKILAIRNKSLEQTKIDPQPPTEAPAAEAVPATEEPAKEVEPIVETPPTEEVVTGWDDTPEVEVSASPQIDYSELGSALSLDGVKSKEDFIAKASELKSKLKEYEEAPLSGVPEDLRDVIKVAKTGDWREMLASEIIDYTKLDPVQEFERDFIARAQNNPKYFTDGKFDPQKVNDALDAMPEASREYHGTQLLEQKMIQQRMRRDQIKAQAEQKRAEAEKSLANATSKLGDILPLETYGIKFEPEHSSEIYNGILNSKLTKKHLGLSYEDLVRSGADMRNITRTITLAEKGEKMIAFKSDKSKVDGKKEVLKTIQNVQLNPTGSSINPETPDEKPKSPVDKMKEYLASQRQGGL